MSKNAKTRFDVSVPRFVAAIRAVLGADVLRNGVVIRDTSGRLSFASGQDEPAGVSRDEVSKRIRDAIGAYARPDRVIAFRDDAGVSRILADPSRIPITSEELTYQLIDRRIVGAAWLDVPNKELSTPPRIVFSSLKGGVGRSTALAIAAADLARRSKNLLVIDLDLEAPGIGDLLLSDSRKPSLGTVDFLVENGIGIVEDCELDEFVGVSELTSGGGGRVDVVPSFGALAATYPENVLPKLARAMIEEVEDSGDTISVTDQISNMIKRLSLRRQYDAVLIDSRAGLSELMAPAILGLGASVLLFGTAQKQTIEGYRSLFAALRLLAERDRAAGGDASWRLMFKAVHAKASLDPNSAARYRDELYDIFSEFLYDAEEVVSPPSDAITFDIDDPTAPHWPLIIPFNPSFADFDSARNANQLTQSFYEQTFRSFMDGIDEILESSIAVPE
jgi:MinD-like ATPase involved in chromosome partitioning or flagellar assembly